MAGSMKTLRNDWWTNGRMGGRTELIIKDPILGPKNASVSGAPPHQNSQLWGWLGSYPCFNRQTDKDSDSDRQKDRYRHTQAGTHRPRQIKTDRQTIWCSLIPLRRRKLLQNRGRQTKNRQSDRQTDRQEDRTTGRQTGRQNNRQTDQQTHG